MPPLALLRCLPAGTALLLLLLAARPVLAQSPLERRAAEVAGLLASEGAGRYDTTFAPHFLSQVPPAQLTGIFVQLKAQVGAVASWTITERTSPSAARLDVRTEGGFRMPVTLSVEGAPPYRIDGLFFANPVPLTGTLDEVIDELADLPGAVSFLAARLDPDGQLLPVASYQPDLALGIGSAFKLYVLAALVEDVDARRRAWDEVVPLAPEHRSLPSGILQDWPEGTPLTLATLATLMISRSDNTATDLLLHTLGRRRVEAMLARTGHHDPALNQPFLSTLELFRLKGDPGGAGDRYLSLDPEARRAFLDTEARAVDRDALELFSDGLPDRIDRLEWFATARDLARVMAHLHAATAEGESRRARALLGVNRGASLSEADWPYVGFKGGSEPGVLNLTFLLERQDGAAFVVAATWNDPETPVDTATLLGRVERAIELLP